MQLCFEENCIKVGESVQVTRRLRSCFEDLLVCAPEERRRAIERQVALLDAVVADNSASDHDPAAWQSDPQGLGTSGVAISPDH